MWTREGQGNLIASLMLSGPIEIGVGRFSDFEIYRKKTEFKKNLILNPIWVELIQSIIPLDIQLGEIKNSMGFQSLSGEDKRLVGENHGIFRRELRVLENESRVSLCVNTQFLGKLKKSISRKVSL